jgi:hypothetical protein
VVASLAEAGTLVVAMKTSLRGPGPGRCELRRAISIYPRIISYSRGEVQRIWLIYREYSEFAGYEKRGLQLPATTQDAHSSKSRSSSARRRREASSGSRRSTASRPGSESRARARLCRQRLRKRAGSSIVPALLANTPLERYIVEVSFVLRWGRRF